MALQCPSRHSRGISQTNGQFKKIYKVFLCYNQQNPTEKCQQQYQKSKYKEIKSFCCSCMNGKRVISPCSHVATLIYYLAWAKFRPMKYPANYLI